MDRTKFYILANFVVIVFSLYFIALHNIEAIALYRLCREDMIIENFQMLIYLFSSIVFFRLALIQRSSRYWYFFYGLLLFFLAGEEVSWGQRLMVIETPVIWAQNNIQQETNIHNLRSIQGHIRALGIIFVSMVCWAIPLLHRYSPTVARIFRRFEFPVFPMGAASIMLVSMLFMVLARILGDGQAVYSFDEVGELWMAFAFFVFAVGERIAFHRRSSNPAG